MKNRVFALLSLASLTAVVFCAHTAAAKSYIAYISDSLAHGGLVRGASDRTLQTIRVVSE